MNQVSTVSMPPGPGPAEPFPAPASQPNPPEVPTGPRPIEDPSPSPDVIDPGVDMPTIPGREPDVPGIIPGGPMVA